MSSGLTQVATNQLVMFGVSTSLGGLPRTTGGYTTFWTPIEGCATHHQQRFFCLRFARSAAPWWLRELVPDATFQMGHWFIPGFPIGWWDLGCCSQLESATREWVRLISFLLVSSGETTYWPVSIDIDSIVYLQKFTVCSLVRTIITTIVIVHCFALERFWQIWRLLHKFHSETPWFPVAVTAKASQTAVVPSRLQQLSGVGN